jgi:hypothetical protein
MKYAAALLLFALAAQARPAAAAEGDLATLAAGEYRCELPGDALGPAGRHVATADFAITTASAYVSAEGTGRYLLAGTVVTFTSGPRKGERFRRASANFLRQLQADGSDGPLRCVRSGANR